MLTSHTTKNIGANNNQTPPQWQQRFGCDRDQCGSRNCLASKAQIRFDKELKGSGFLQDDSSSNMELYYQPRQEPKYSYAQSRAAAEEKAHIRVHCQLEEQREEKLLANWSSPFAMSRMVSLVFFHIMGAFCCQLLSLTAQVVNRYSIDNVSGLVQPGSHCNIC
jgi:hypothetical protein